MDLLFHSRDYTISKFLGRKSFRKHLVSYKCCRGEASEKKIEEMKNLINNKWDWQVRQMDVNEFVIVFPDKGTFDTFSKISEILMNVHGIKVKILKSNMDPDAVEMLQAT
jgi:hypothetical protein